MRYARVLIALLLCAVLFSSARAPEAAADEPPLSMPFVRHAQTIPERPLEGDFVRIQLQGWFPTPCGEVLPESTLSSTPYAIRLVPRSVCRDSTDWWWIFDVGQLRAGTHRVEIVLAIAPSPTDPPTQVHRRAFEFTVLHRDSTPPPIPIPGPLPFVDAIRITPKPVAGVFEPPICPDDSILVSISGHFPSDCWSLDRIDLIRYPTMGILPAPPVVRLLVDDNACQDRLCIARPTPWRGAVAFESLPRGPYSLRIELVKVSCADSAGPSDSVHVTHVPFRVDSCNVEPPVGCLAGGWVHPVAPGQCDAFVSPEQPARVTLTVFSPVALAGLQGRLSLAPAGMDIVRLEPAGAAAGMRLSWTPAELGGARFVLFAEDGAPIPASDPEHPVPVLRVEVAMSDAAIPPPPNVYVSVHDLLGSDAAGNGVPECRWRNCERCAVLPPTARICAQRDCDFNADQRIDVRDLVLMVRCLRGAAECPDTARFDCTDDGSFTLDDVFCCAVRLLGRVPCTDCPPDTMLKRPEPGVQLAFGAPVEVGDGLSLPIRFEGVSRVGAARFALRYPADRYDVAGVDFVDAGSDWLTLHEVQDGRVVVGLLQINPIPEQAASLAPMEVRLRLALKPGQTPGGEVTCADEEFSGTDGVPLEIAVERSSPPLGGPAPIALSANRPNPFSGSTQFALTLARAGRVEIGVYDVAGRQVASLHAGPLEAGSHEFTWDGRGASASGIYFVRAEVPGAVVSRRVVLLRNR